MTKNEMLTLIIKKFGFEHEYTIQFAKAMEWLGREELKTLMNEMLTLPLDIEDENE